MNYWRVSNGIHNVHFEGFRPTSQAARSSYFAGLDDGSAAARNTGHDSSGGACACRSRASWSRGSQRRSVAQ